jgi:hypothetical protein
MDRDYKRERGGASRGVPTHGKAREALLATLPLRRVFRVE